VRLFAPLRTAHRREAERLYHGEALAACEGVDEPWRTHRERLGNSQALTAEWLRRALEADAEGRVNQRTEAAAEAEESYFVEWADETETALRFGDFDEPAIVKFLVEALGVLGVDAPADKQERRRLAHELLKARAEFLRVVLRRSSGDWTETGGPAWSVAERFAAGHISEAIFASFSMVTSDENPTLSTLLDEWEEGAREGRAQASLGRPCTSGLPRADASARWSVTVLCGQSPRRTSPSS
jgi:hypothetical protein